MRPINRTWLFVGASFLAFLLAGWQLPALLDLDNPARWILRGGLWLLGLLFASLLYRLLTRLASKDPEPAEDEIGARIQEAASRLRSSSLSGGGRLGRLPLVLVLGPEGSTKTTLITRSGLDLELLAGEVSRGDVVLPTDVVNLWYGGRTVFLEAAGNLLNEPERWRGLARRVRPDRVAAAFTGRGQAPRAAIVCFSCDDLLKPGAADAATAQARTLRPRLQELSQRLGVRLPVYVVFSRTDRVPYFSDFVRNLSEQEARQVLGATVPLESGSTTAPYAERQAMRLTRAFDELFRALTASRIEQLPREAMEEARAAAYEFPRELRKIARPATAFLIELCRPSQLGVSPFLRGFYFTGVRAVVLSDQAVDVLAPARLPASPPLGATMVFNPRTAPTPMPAAPTTPGSRKAPQWLFVERLMSRVILGDEVARRVTAGGTRVNGVRRALLGAVTAAFVIAAVGFTVSFRANRRLARDVLEAMRGAETLVEVAAGVPAGERLQRLDALRAQAARLRTYRSERPWHLGWGLSAGAELHSPVRRLYFDRFDRLLGRRALGNLRAYLSALPERPSAVTDYAATYAALKAYLITSSHASRSTGAFLAPILTRHWASGARIEPSIRDLARAQFAFYGGELAYGNPEPREPDASLVIRTRAFLGQFTDAARLYRAMVSDASAALADDAATRFLASSRALRNPYVVPAAFTAPGWQTVQQSLANLDRLFAREAWVTGGQSVESADLTRLAGRLRARYVRDYVGHWQRYLSAASVVPFGGPADAADALGVLSGNESPLLRTLHTAARNTTVDSVQIAPIFQPVHVVTPPNASGRYIGDANKPYIDALGALRASLERVADAVGPARGQALSQARGAADQADAAIRLLTQGFRVDGRAQAVGNAVRRLLEAPIHEAERLIRSVPTRALNREGAAFCRAFDALAGKYPFDADAATAASVQEIDAMFRPGESTLWALYENVLRDLLAPQGSGYAPRPGATPQPSDAFVRFFNRAAAVSDAFYRAEGSGPAIDFILRFETSTRVPEVRVSIDGQDHTFTRTFVAGQRFRWEGARAQNASVTGRLQDGREVVLVDAPPGRWALFRLLQRAEWQAIDRGRYLLEWPVRGRQFTVAAELILTSSVPILNADYLADLDCVPTIASM